MIAEKARKHDGRRRLFKPAEQPEQPSPARDHGLEVGRWQEHSQSNDAPDLKILREGAAQSFSGGIPHPDPVISDAGFRPIARHTVDPAVRKSVEFTSACPDTALVMVKEL